MMPLFTYLREAMPAHGSKLEPVRLSSRMGLERIGEMSN